MVKLPPKLGPGELYIPIQHVRNKRLAVYKKIVAELEWKWMVKEFIDQWLNRNPSSKDSFVRADILRMPIGTRIIIYADRPSRVIGRRGQTIKELSSVLQAKLAVENPQIDVIDIAKVTKPEWEPRVIAYRLANAIARGVKFRRAVQIAIRQILESGARGVEIVVSGKLTSERARFEKYTIGKVYKNGYDAKALVKRVVMPVLLKPGIYGIEVRILPGDARTSDDFRIKPPVKEAVAAEQQVSSA